MYFLYQLHSFIRFMYVFYYCTNMTFRSKVQLSVPVSDLLWAICVTSTNNKRNVSLARVFEEAER